MESADLKPRKIVLKKSLSTTTTSTTTITISTNDVCTTRESNNKSDGDGDASFNEAATAQQRESSSSSSSDVIANVNEKSNATTTTTTMTHEAHLLLEKKLREKLIEAQRSLNEIEQNKDKNGSSCVATKHEKETKGILFDLNKFYKLISRSKENQCGDRGFISIAYTLTMIWDKFIF